MTVNRNLRLDKFKGRSLQCLETKKEGQRFYPIEKADLMTVETCVICGSRSISRLTEVYLAYELNCLSTSVCHDCLYTFRSISPSHQWFKKCWATISTKELEVFNPVVEEIRKERYKKYCGLLSKYVRNSTVLDVGAGYGTGSKVFQDHGYTVEALEPEDDKANYIEKYLNIPVYATSIEEFISRKKNYGLILLAHCLEHLDDPALIISNITKLLDPENGILYVEIPVIWNIVTWTDALFLGHKSNFTEENIFYLATKNGFRLLEQVYYQHTVDEPWDLGLVMKATEKTMQLKAELKNNKEGYGIDDIRRLYRKNLPVTPTPAVEEIIKYNVPYIDHFYYTLRLDSKTIVQPQRRSDFISLDSIGAG